MIRPFIFTHYLFPTLVIRSYHPVLSTRCSSSMFSLLSAIVGLSRVNISRPSLLSWPAWRFFSQSHVEHAGSEDPIAQRKRLDEQMKRHLLPVLREKRNAMRMARYYKNPQDERERERLRRKTQREQNPAGYQVLQKRHYLARIRKQANDPRYGFVKRLHGWCMKYDWVREELPWETHVPVVYSEKVSKQCSGCTHYTVAKGLKLWLERLY